MIEIRLFNYLKVYSFHKSDIQEKNCHGYQSLPSLQAMFKQSMKERILFDILLSYIPVNGQSV